MVEKRGGNLVAPLPKATVGQCGYLNELTQDELIMAISEYQAICLTYPRGGKGVDPLCSDVGLEDPSTVAHHIPTEDTADILDASTTAVSEVEEAII
jgi:3-dehydroquinate synthase